MLSKAHIKRDFKIATKILKLTPILLAMLSATALANDNENTEVTQESEVANPYYDDRIQVMPSQVILRDAKKEWNDKRFPINEWDVKNYIGQSGVLERSFTSNMDTKLIKHSINIDPTKPQDFPTIVTAQGFNTIVTFWDTAGNPWDVEYAANGNSKQFEVQQPPNIDNKNIIIIIPKANYSRTNITVSLRAEKKPIVFQVETNDVKKSKTAFGEVSVNLMKRNPEIALTSPVIDNTMNQSTEDSIVLLSFLDNIPPKEARKLSLSGEAQLVEAWEFDEHYYVKTPHNLVWPPVKSVQTDGNNYMVYKTAKTPLIRVTDLSSGQNRNIEVSNNER